MATERKSPDLIFEEPPPDGRGGKAGQSPIGLWLAALRGHPGEWAKFPEQLVSSGAGGAIRKGTGYGVKPGEFDAVMRAGTNKRYWLYARYIGGDK